jgi:RIP metalloprotease RseP
MTVLIAIAGLGFLILIHEAGHFFTAMAVGMRPRRFYIGFPPALVKTKRGGVEYGIGAIPLGGYVKIPGMHRPAPSDLDVHFGTALYEAPQLLQSIERVKRPLAEGEFESARIALEELEAALATTQLSTGARRQAKRGLSELSDALGSDAYWRQRT